MTEADKVAAKLQDKMKKHTITIGFKNGTVLELQSDAKLRPVFDAATREVALEWDDYNHPPFACRWVDVLYINHVNNKDQP